jgi:hypothetical protein
MTVESIDIGYFTATLSYTPSWATAPFTISIGTGPDSNGTAWIWEQLQGWDSPDVAGQVLQRGADHGGWPAGAWYAPRTLTLQLRASAINQYYRDVARAQLQQILPVNDLALLQYNEPIPKQAYIRRAGKVTETYDNLAEVDFAAVLIAPDPRKYSQAYHTWSPTSYQPSNFITIGSAAGSTYTTIGGISSLPINSPPGITSGINLGNFETRPIMYIYGPVVAPLIQLVNTGQIVSWSQLALNTGDVLMIDFDARMAYKNPNYRICPGGAAYGTVVTPANISGYTPADITSSWFVLQPGVNGVQVGSYESTFANSSQLVVQHRDAWI